VGAARSGGTGHSKRYHDIQISNSGVWRILKRLDLNQLPASQRHKRHDRNYHRPHGALDGQGWRGLMSGKPEA
jgi:hypothetical protein